MSSEKWAEDYDLCLATWECVDFTAHCWRPDGHDGRHERHMAGGLAGWRDVVAVLSWEGSDDD